MNERRVSENDKAAPNDRFGVFTASIGSVNEPPLLVSFAARKAASQQSAQLLNYRMWQSSLSGVRPNSRHPDAFRGPAVQDVLALVELNAIANSLADHLFDAIEKKVGERPAPERDDAAAMELSIRLGLAIAVAVCGKQSPQRVADRVDIRLAIDTDM
jgi:hypothetical protein